jgi:hypothetical protein
VKSGDCRPCIVLRESAHSRNFPGRRLHTASSALHSARNLAVKIKLKKLSQNLKAFPFKINAEIVHPAELCGITTW